MGAIRLNFKQPKVAVGILVLATFLPSILIVTASPDTAPTVEWDTILIGNNPEVCDTNRFGAGLTTDLSGNVYSVESCHTTSSANVDIHVIKTSSTAAQVWSKTVDCGAVACRPYGIAAGSDGMVGMGFYDEGSMLAIKMRFFVFRQSNGEIVCNVGGQGATFPDGFTTDIGSPSTTQTAHSLAVYKHDNGTTVYIMGGPSGSVAVTHYAVGGCGEFWVGASGSRGDASVAYNRRTNLAAVMTVDPSAQFMLINATTGAQVAITSITGVTYTNYLRGNTTDRLWTVENSAVNIEFKEFNSTTGVLVRTRTPIEPVINIPASADDFTALRGGFWVDGADQLFVCGSYFHDAFGEPRPAAAKYNSTQLNGMRWNVTFGSTAAGSVGERAGACEIASNGALYIIWRIDSGSDQVHMRKYGNAGVPNIRDTAYVLPGDNETVVPGAGDVDVATGFKNFCLFTGFTSDASKFFCGLVYVMTGSVLVGAIASRMSDRKATAISAGIAAVCLMIFVVLIELWDVGSTVLLIILASAFIVAVGRNLFLSKE